MLAARVIGNATATVAHASLKGVRLLLCEALDSDGKPTGKVLVAGDWLGAGRGGQVLVTSDGDAALAHTGDPRGPLRNVILGLVDSAGKEAEAS